MTISHLGFLSWELFRYAPCLFFYWMVSDILIDLQELFTYDGFNPLSVISVQVYFPSFCLPF